MDFTQNISDAKLFSAKDLVVVLTGGGSGIGAAFASALAQSSARKVYILGRRLPSLQATASTINALPGLAGPDPVVVPVQCDVTDRESAAAAAQRVHDDAGGYADVLINNAGVTGPKHTAVYGAQSLADVQVILQSNADGWPATFATNTAAVVGVAAAFLPLLDAANRRRGWEPGKLEPGAKPRGRGLPRAEGVEDADVRTSQIITVASIAAFNRYVTAGLAYSSSKAGAVHIGKTLATMLAPWGIRSNVLCPGIFPSQMTEGAPTEFPADKIPSGRQGSFEDLAAYLLYLVGKGGSYVNGSVQLVDGGRLSMHPATY
ncbi:hypothetical protein BDY21DRAFT_311955 [Lineolata rhizophorae]|uniref:NAD(P)-binding protein n=1 Tax=Lineolata rhizophorae TaxID=578093 RepID=A0A6A6NML1_9PEZI|nr:hypothetical protein BDY21DRAFT_311955 [Lineolata rhizophorae]